jgi:hypothetical protein
VSRLRGTRVLLVAGLIAALSGFGASGAAAAKGPANCGGKPGSPENAALLQYCPKGAKSGSGAPAAIGQPTNTAPGPPAGQAAKGKASHQVATDKPSLPLTNYPSSGGINALILVLVLVALGGTVAYGARRWRRSRPQPSR